MLIKSHQTFAFTLLELLVVVAIIAILAAITVPNLLESQNRSRLARVRADLRNLATALETYAADHGKYPPVTGTFSPGFATRLAPLTTPIAYLSSLPADPFRRATDSWRGQVNPTDPDDFYAYNTDAELVGVGGGTPRGAWSLTSGGPDGRIDFPYYAFGPLFLADRRYVQFMYDPTNGTISYGDIFRRGGLALESVTNVDGW